MPRKRRIQYSGAVYHVMNRGNRKEPIFIHDSDRDLFLKTLGECCQKYHMKIHAYCLMRNHFHLIVETEFPNLDAAMRWLEGTYAMRFHKRRHLVGHLFGGRYKAQIIDGSKPNYFRTVLEYVGLNPVRANLIGRHIALKSYRWSSIRYYLATPQERPVWLTVDRGLLSFGIPEDSRAGRLQFEKMIEERRFTSRREDVVVLRKAWCIGDAEFRNELLEQTKRLSHLHKLGAPSLESEVERADVILSNELRRRSMSEQDLKVLPKTHRTKVEIASMMRCSTGMTTPWLVSKLHMGSVATFKRALAIIQAEHEG